MSVDDGATALPACLALIQADLLPLEAASPHLLHMKTHNRGYVSRLRRQRRASTIGGHYVYVLKIPFPLSYEDHGDIAYVTGRQRR